MEYVPGGDLSSLLKAMGTFDKKSIQIYSSEITLALEYLHGRKQEKVEKEGYDFLTPFIRQHRASRH
jgi:serine/threonine protein kinase